MKYQLVLQFPADSIDDFDQIVSMENSISECLGSDHDVDGHDFGSGEANIFIFTNLPEKVFEKVQKIKDLDIKKNLKAAAYRDIESENYTILYSVDNNEDFNLI